MLEINKYILDNISKQLASCENLLKMPAFDFYFKTLDEMGPQIQLLKEYIKDFDKTTKPHLASAFKTLEVLSPMLQRFEISLGDARQKNIETQKLNGSQQTPATKEESAKIDDLIKEVRELREKIEKVITAKNHTAQVPETFEISIKDREIWINNFLLSRPHAVGTNYETFDEIRRKSTNKPIKKADFPNWLKEEIGDGSLADIIYQLGFTGEILKAFFPKRSKKGIIQYAGDKINKKDLQNRGINVALLMKQLELAHIKNNPE